MKVHFFTEMNITVDVPEMTTEEYEELEKSDNDKYCCLVEELEGRAWRLVRDGFIEPTFFELEDYGDD